MNSQQVLQSIATYRANHNGETPALIVVDGNTIECIDYSTLVFRSQENDEYRICDEYMVFIVNYSLADFYANNIPVMLDKYIKTTIKDYMFALMEAETRP